MARNVLGIVFVLTVIVLTVGASVPPNLDMTLKAQREQVVERPYDAEVYNDLGNLLTLDGNDEEAEEAYRKAIELAPEGTLARFNLGVLLQQMGRQRAAITEFKGVLEVEERHARAHYQLGTLYESRRQRGKALAHYAKAFAFDTDLTFPNKNPHLIDNRLATEAMLMSARYADTSSSETIRLYGEPDRIADLMLQRSTEEPAAPPVPEVAWESTPTEAADQRSPANFPTAGDEDEDDDDGDGDDDDDDEDDEDEDDEDDQDGRSRAGRRTLTSEDLDAGSTIGRAQRVGSTPTTNRRRRPAIGTGRADAAGRNQGRSQGSSASGRQQPPTRRVPTPPTTRTNTGRPRYIPSSASTGRLELELLPLPAAPVERLAEQSSAASGQTLKRM